MSSLSDLSDEVRGAPSQREHNGLHAARPDDAVVVRAAANGGARIGPNAISRTLEALRERVGGTAADELLVAARLERYRDEVPTAMVPEADVTALYGALRMQLGIAGARGVSLVAGYKTADYVLTNRIPKPVRVLLRVLPPRLAAPLLLRAIANHTWTFAGSGRVVVAAGPPVRITIAGCPICRASRSEVPLCSYFAASFEGLFRELVCARSAAVETTCAAQGAPTCAFEIRW